MGTRNGHLYTVDSWLLTISKDVPHRREATTMLAAITLDVKFPASPTSNQALSTKPFLLCWGMPGKHLAPGERAVAGKLRQNVMGFRL
jgi:hypothetical protein